MNLMTLEYGSMGESLGYFFAILSISLIFILIMLNFWIFFFKSLSDLKNKKLIRRYGILF